MDKKGKHQSASIFGGMGLYIALLVCVIAAGVVGYYALTHDTETKKNDGPMAETVDNVKEAPAAPVVADRPVEVERPKPPQRPPVQEPKPMKEEKKAPPAPAPEPIKETKPEPPKVEPVEVISPLAGETVAVFSAGELSYDPTLADWRTHDGMDIRAEAGTTVVASSKGVVLSVEEDSRLGTTVKIDHGNGYVTTYASLQPEVDVLAGDPVEAGTPIGYVGNTALSEAALGAHLHFAVEKDGEIQDPESYLKG